MNGTIADVLTALHRQWGEIYVTVHDNVALTEEIQARLAEMSAHSTRMLNFALVCASVAFVLAVGAATFLLYRKMRDRNE